MPKAVEISSPRTTYGGSKHSFFLLIRLLHTIGTAEHIGGDRFVELAGVGQVEIVHNIQELGQGLGQAGVEKQLFLHGGARQALVVVGGINHAGGGQGQDLGVH